MLAIEVTWFLLHRKPPQPAAPCGTSLRGCCSLLSPAQREVFEVASELRAASSPTLLQSATGSFQGAVAALRFAPTLRKCWFSSPPQPHGESGDASHAAGLQRVPTGAVFDREFAAPLGEIALPPGALGRSGVISKAANTTLPASVQRLEVRRRLSNAREPSFIIPNHPPHAD